VRRHALPRRIAALEHVGVEERLHEALVELVPQRLRLVTDCGRAVETWFFPASADEPYWFEHVLDEPATPELEACARDRG
jgi:hypothetical protein